MKQVFFWLVWMILPATGFCGIQAVQRVELYARGDRVVQEGGFFADHGIIRVDQEFMGKPYSTLIDPKGQRMTILNHSHRVFMESVLEGPSWYRLAGGFSRKDRRALKKQGVRLRRLSEEVVREKKCQAYQFLWLQEGHNYELDVCLANELGISLPWHTKLRIDGELVQETALTQIQNKKLDSGLFAPPADYGRFPQPQLTLERRPNHERLDSAKNRR